MRKWIAGCSLRGDVRVIGSKLLPRPIRMSKGKNLLIKLTGKTKPGKYTIVLLCEDKHQVPDSVDVKSVRIYTVLGAFQQEGHVGIELPGHLDDHARWDVPVALPEVRQRALLDAEIVRKLACGDATIGNELGQTLAGGQQSRVAGGTTNRATHAAPFASPRSRGGTKGDGLERKRSTIRRLDGCRSMARPRG